MSDSTTIENANQLRGEKFKSLIRRPVAWVSILVAAIIALGVLAAIGLPAIGGAAFVVVGLIGVLVVFVIADNQAEDAFYDAFCESHGLTRLDGGRLDESTDLLRKGDKRRTVEMFTGQLAEGIDGCVALYTYTNVSRDSDGDETETDYPFTVIKVELPETVAHLPELRVHGRVGFKFMEGVEDKFRFGHERLTLESEAMRDRYEVFVKKGQDQIWLRRLFSPSFIVWLTEAPPKDFAFELENGSLVAFIPKHMDDIEGFEKIMAAGTHVTGRLREEVAQTTVR